MKSYRTVLPLVIKCLPKAALPWDWEEFWKTFSTYVRGVTDLHSPSEECWVATCERSHLEWSGTHVWYWLAAPCTWYSSSHPPPSPALLNAFTPLGNRFTPSILRPNHTSALVPLSFLASCFLFRVESHRERTQVEWSSGFQNRCRHVCFRESPAEHLGNLRKCHS